MLVCLTFDPPGRTIEILSLVLYWLTLRGVYIYNEMKKWFSKGNIRDHDHKSSFGFEELKKKIIIDYPCLMMWMRIEQKKEKIHLLCHRRKFSLFLYPLKFARIISWFFSSSYCISCLWHFKMSLVSVFIFVCNKTHKNEKNIAVEVENNWLLVLLLWFQYCK